ncbi:MAG: hypothetical protein ACXVIY_05440 [Mucilaginibacter sp.]
MFKASKAGYNRSQSTVVLALVLTYVFFVLSYVSYLPNYNLIRLGGNHISGVRVVLKTGTHRSGNYAPPVDKGVWLEKISKTTPETKRGPGLVLMGTVIILSSISAARIFPGSFTPTHKQRRGYTIFAHQYAYLSLRTFRI